MKRCITCRRDKPLTEFHLHRTGGTRRRGECKACTATRAKLRYLRLKTGEIAPKPRPAPTGKAKKCPRCDTERDLADYDRDSRTSDGLHSHCKPCRAETNRLYLIGERTHT